MPRRREPRRRGRRHALTLRFACVPGRDRDVHAHLASLGRTLVARPGFVGAHVLRHQDPALATTTEQKIRSGRDRVAEGVFVACGYDADALAALRDTSLGDGLAAVGVAPGHVAGLYALSHSATPADVA